MAQCIARGVVGGDRFATDASLIAADANKQNSTAKEDWNLDTINPETASRAVVEYLLTLDDEAFGAATDVMPKFTSHSDPSSQWTAAHHGPAFFAYSNNYLIDTDHAIIVDVQASRSVRTGETHATRTMIDRVRERFDLWPERLIADMAYGSGEMLGWLVHERGIEPHIPVIDKSKRDDGTFSREDFAYDVEADIYICPAGKELRRNRRNFRTIRSEPKDTSFTKYGAAKADCEACPLKQRCCPKGTPRRVLRSQHEGARQMARDIAKTEDYAISSKLRKKVEMLFAHLKRILGLRRLRLRGPCGANRLGNVKGEHAAPPVDLAAQTMNSSSQQPPRTSESSQSSSRCQTCATQRDPHPLAYACGHLADTSQDGFFNGIRPMPSFRQSR